MNLIVAIDRGNGIGRQGNLLYKIPADLRYFKQMTMGKVVVMGHSTLKALPGARPLPGRENIVLTRSADTMINGCTICHSLKELFDVIAAYKSDDVFIIGGENVYMQLMDYCGLAYVTKIQSVLPADKFFPKLEEEKNWSLISETEEKDYNGLRFTFQVFKNLAVKAL